MVARMEQLDQLWHMDSEGYIHGTFDYERCMMVPSYGLVGDGKDSSFVDEAPVEIGPCDDENALNQSYYDNGAAGGGIGMSNMLKLSGYDDCCVTFLGGAMATKGAPMVITPCVEDQL